jgi:hypothetical protein
MSKVIKYIVRVIASIGATLMLCILSIKTLSWIYESGVEVSSYRICGGFILVATLYLACLIWWYIGLGKEGYEEYKKRKQ